MPDFRSQRLAAASAIVGGTAFAVVGALQATDLNWTENAVKTPLQHLTMAFYAVGLVAVVPAVAALGRTVSGRAGYAWVAIAVGQVGVAAASSVSNVRGVDASWFPAVAIAANALWVLGTLTLAAALYRSRTVPRLIAVGLVAAYIGAIPLATHGGGIITGCFWLAVAYLLTLGALERRAPQLITL